MADKDGNHQRTGHSAEDKARHEAIREKLNGRPTPEELMESGAYELPVPHGLVLDAMRLLGQLGACPRSCKSDLGRTVGRSRALLSPP